MEKDKDIIKKMYELLGGEVPPEELEQAKDAAEDDIKEEGVVLEDEDIVS